MTDRKTGGRGQPQIITVALQKGGTGKSTTAAVLAQAAAYRGKRALAIDMDPQGNLSFALGADMQARGCYELLEGGDPAGLIQTTGQGVDVIPASWNLSTISSARGSARRLQKALQPIKDNYDLILIDTPATAGELQYNALQAATGLIIPLQANTYNIQSLYQITDTARQFQESNPALQITGYILTMYDARTTIARQMALAIDQTAQEIGVPYLGTIRRGVAIQEAATLQQSLFEYAPKSKPALDYMALYDKITEGR